MEDLLEGDVEGRIRKQRPADRREEQMTREVERQYELISAQKATAEASKPTETASAATIEQEGLLSDAQAADDTKEIAVAPLYRGVASGDIRTGGVIDVDGKASESRELSAATRGLETGAMNIDSRHSCMPDRRHHRCRQSTSVSDRP